MTSRKTSNDKTTEPRKRGTTKSGTVGAATATRKKGAKKPDTKRS